MAKPSTTLRNVEETLQSVIVGLVDAQKGFQKLGESMKNGMVKRYFLAESLKRAEFRGALETVLHQEGMHDIVEEGGIGGAISRAWMGLQKMLHEGDHALLVTAEQAESETAQSYSDAVDSELPLPLRKLLLSQAAHIEGSLDCIRTMRDSSK